MKSRRVVKLEKNKRELSVIVPCIIPLLYYQAGSIRKISKEEDLLLDTDEENVDSIFFLQPSNYNN